jgi:predicted nucleotidyltransferase
LGTKVDVVPKEDIRPELKKNILSEAVDIWRGILKYT